MTLQRDQPPEITPSALEQDIGRRRAEIGLTIAALERKLAARHLVEEGMNMVTESLNGSQAMKRGLDAMLANPIPCALIGIGAAWLVAANTGVVDRLAHDDRVDTAKRRAGEFASDLGTRASGLASDLGTRAGGLASDLGTRAGGLAEGAIRSVRETASSALNGAGSSASDKAGAMADRVIATIEHNPLIVGALGVMAGALLATLVPMSRSESGWLSEKRDELSQKAQEIGQRAVTQARETAGQVAEGASQVAKDAIDAGSNTFGNGAGTPPHA
jgi:hypothetical protein